MKHPLSANGTCVSVGWVGGAATMARAVVSRPMAATFTSLCPSIVKMRWRRPRAFFESRRMNGDTCVIISMGAAGRWPSRAQGVAPVGFGMTIGRRSGEQTDTWLRPLNGFTLVVSLRPTTISWRLPYGSTSNNNDP